MAKMSKGAADAARAALESLQREGVQNGDAKLTVLRGARCGTFAPSR